MQSIKSLGLLLSLIVVPALVLANSQLEDCARNAMPGVEGVGGTVSVRQSF
jgi:hypothetical protein